MVTPNNVGSVFLAAGEALTFFGELTMSLHSTPSSTAGKWNDEEIEMLHEAVARFGDNLSKLQAKIQERENVQKGGVKKEEFEDADIPYESIVNVQMTHEISDNEVFIKSESAEELYCDSASQNNSLNTNVAFSKKM